MISSRLNGLSQIRSFCLNRNNGIRHKTEICDDKGICDTTIIVVSINPITPCNGITVNSIIKEASCNNNDGEIDLFATGATSFKYNWSPNVSNTNSAKNIPAGIYTITVSDFSNPNCNNVIIVALSNKNGPFR